jgi:hypothetical protein
MTYMAKKIDNAVFQAASSIVHSGVGPEEALAKLRNQFPFIKEDVMVGGLKHHWVQVVRANMQNGK